MSNIESFVQQAAADKALKGQLVTALAEAVAQAGSSAGYSFTVDDVRGYMRAHGWSMQSFLDNAPKA